MMNFLSVLTKNNNEKSTSKKRERGVIKQIKVTIRTSTLHNLKKIKPIKPIKQENLIMHE